MRFKHRSFIVIFAATLVITSLIGNLALHFYKSSAFESASERVNGKLRDAADELNEYVEAKRQDVGAVALSADEFKDTASEFVSIQKDCTIVLPDGTVFGDTLPPAQTSDIFYDAESARITVALSVHFENGESILYVSVPYNKNAISNLAVILFISTLSVSLTAAFAGYFISAAFEKKLSKMNLDAANYAADKEARFPKYRQAELDRIAKSLNQAADARVEDMNKLQVIADGRKQFTDNLAHEMKTPLTSILGFADILRIRRSVDDKSRMEYAAIIFEEAKRLRGLSGKLLELATAGNTKLDFKTVDVPDFFDEIRLSILPLLSPRKITLAVYSDNVQINVDPELFKSLLYNLIENAVKASPDGSEIRLICKANADTIKISVADSGCGMTKDQIRKAAEPFYMVDKSRSRKAGGVGLGLALCREIAEKHRARMLIQSAPGKGTTVTLIMLTVLNAPKNEVKK